MPEFSEFGSREHDGWSDGGIVDAYIKHFVPITDGVGKEIVARHLSSVDEVLDLCCGQGTLTASIAKNWARVTGLDFSPEMIARARVTAPAANIVEGNATAMLFEDAQFDKVDEPTELFDVFLTATVGARMLIRSQTAETVEKISDAIAKTVSEKHFDGTRYNVPVPVALVSASAA